MRTVVLATGIVSLLWCGLCWGNENDIQLGRFAKKTPYCSSLYNTTINNPNPGPCFMVDDESNALFKDLMMEMGNVFGPVFLAPAETLGMSGFSVGLEASIHNINQEKEYWMAVEDASPDSVMSTFRLHMRKGLPWSFELGGIVTYLAKSEMFAVGMELKWALEEGHYYVPDIAFRGTVNRVLGAPDFDLTVVGIDGSISKCFGIASTFNLTPYTGYSLIFIEARSHVVDATPGINPYTTTTWTNPTTGANETNLPGYDSLNNVVFDDVSEIDHRWFIGLRMIFGHLEAAVEGIIGPTLQTFSFKLGVDF